MLRREWQALQGSHLLGVPAGESLSVKSRQPFFPQPVQGAAEEPQDEEDGQDWLNRVHHRPPAWNRTMRTAKRPLASANSAKPTRDPAASTSTVSPACRPVL